jgi:riboflavin transporter FmnP
MAALHSLVFGIAAGLVILPAVSILYVMRAVRLFSTDGAVGCLIVTVLTVTAAVLGFDLFIALPLFHWVRPC